jgi:hypothetical protein
LEFLFSSCSFRCTFVYHFLVLSLLYFPVFRALHLFVFSIYLSLFSWYSCRGDYESGGGQWKCRWSS